MPTSSDNKLPQAEDELWALTVLENLRDTLRFRFDGLRPDLLRERPTGFEQSMVEVLASLHHGEQLFQTAIMDAIKVEKPTLSTNFNIQSRHYVHEPTEELGTLLKIREATLHQLRKLSEDEWLRVVDDPARGERSVRDLAIERAHADLALLERLKAMRHALHSSLSRTGIRTLQGEVIPDSSY